LESEYFILIEVSAQAIGASFEDFALSIYFGDISCISFDRHKTVSACGTGVMQLPTTKIITKTRNINLHHGRNEEGNFEILLITSKISELSAY
jgi:dTDP-4-amino-4,6-dideoxygalactose transaminase